MSMGITGTTTFSEIYQQQTTDGGSLQNLEGGKHLRFKDDNLYTHDSGKSHSINFIGRAIKHHEAVKTIKASIDRELGPGNGDQVFKMLGLSSRKVTVDQLELIRGEVELRKKIAPFVPKDTNLTRTESGDHVGQAKLTWTDEHITEMRELFDDVKNSELSKSGPVTKQFMKDVDRDTIRLHDEPFKSDEQRLREENLRILHENLEETGLYVSDDKTDDQGPPPPPKLTEETAIDDLKKYSGGNETVCANLSRFLQQDVWSSLMTRVYRQENEYGDKLTPYVDLGKCERSYDVYRDGDNFVVDFTWHSPVTGYTEGSTLSQLLSNHTLDMTMRMTVSREDLANGVLNNYEITKGPVATINLTYRSTDEAL